MFLISRKDRIILGSGSTSPHKTISFIIVLLFQNRFIFIKLFSIIINNKDGVIK